MKLRHPSPADLDTLVEMGRAAHGEGWYADFPYSPERTRQTVEAAMVSHDCLPLVVETPSGEIAGFFIGVVSPNWFTDTRYAMDLVTYVAPRYRNGAALRRLVAAFEAWCRIKKIEEVILGMSNGTDPERADPLFRRLGYRPLLTAYRKKCVWPD